MAGKDKIEKFISIGTDVDTSNGEKKLNDFINKNRIIKLKVEPTKSFINEAYRKIQEEFNKKPPIYFNVAIRKSSISKAMSDLRGEISNIKPITVSVVPKMDVDSSQFAGRNSIARIKNYIQSLLKDVEVKLTPKFDMRSITASIRNMKQELNKVTDGEPITKLSRRMRELSDEAKKVAQSGQQATRAQTNQNQAVIVAEKELERLARNLDNVYRSSTKIQRANLFGGPVKAAADKYKQKLEEIYKLKRQIGQLRSDGDATRELLGRSTISGNRNFRNAVNNRIQGIFESLAGRYGRQEMQSRERAGRTSNLQNIVSWGTYGAKFLGRSAKGTGSALEASAMGTSDAFKLITSSAGVVGKSLGIAGVAISLFTGGLAVGIEVTTKLFSVFEQLIGVVYRLLQPGIELYKQVTKATYSMGAAIASNAKFGEQQVSLATGIATSANLQKKAMLDAEVSVFDFSEIIQSLSGTLPILLGKGMSVEEAYQTNLGVASVAKLTNLAPNQVLQETRDLAQGSITARSSQVANALGITNADIVGKSADEIFKVFTAKFQNYKDVLNQYAETPVGAFEQMMDRLRTVSMKFVEEIAYPFKEMFNWLTDFTGYWVDSEKRKLTRVDMGDGTTEQFWLKGGIDTKNDDARYSIREAMDKLDGDLTKLTEAIDRATKGSATATDSDILSQFGLDSSSLVGMNSKDILDSLFGNITEASGGAEFFLGPELNKLKESFVELFKYLGGALDEILAHIADTFGADGATDVIDLFTEAVKWLIDTTKDATEWTISLIKGLITYARISETVIDIIGGLIRIIWNCSEILYDLITLAVSGAGILFSLIASGINDLIGWVADKFGISYDTEGRQSRIDSNIEYYQNQYLGGLQSLTGDIEDIKDTVFGNQEESKNKTTFFLDKITKGIENMERQNAKRDARKGDAKDPNLLRGTPKNKVDEKALRAARKAEKKAFDKYIAQLRDALEKHIQELKDALDKNEAAYKQGLKNYDAYVQDKLKFEIEEQVAKREELQAEIEAIKSTGKYESEDEREKDLYEADKKLQSINTEIKKLTTTQNEVAGILNDGNQLLKQLVGLNRASNEKKGKEDNSNLTTKVETKEARLDVSGLLGLENIDSLEDRKSWAMQYLRESGFASDNASSILAHALANSADLSGNIFNFDSDTLNAYATQAGLNLANASDMFKASIAIATEKIKEAIPTDNAYTLDQFNAELKKLGMFIGDADLSVMNELVHSFKPFVKQITTTTHTLGNANNVVNQAVNGYKEGEMWKNPVKDWIPPDKMCDSWVGDVYFKSGVKNIGGIDIVEGSIITDQMFEDSGYWHGANSGYVPKAGDYISGAHHVGVVLDGDKVRSRDSTGGVRTWPRASWIDEFGIEGYGEISPFIGSGTNAIKDVSEKIIRGTTSTYTGEGLQAIEMKEKYLTTEFDLLAQLDKYEQNSFDTIDALSKSAEAIKKNIEAKYKILKTTGLNDEQQKRIISYEERLRLYQVQETMAKLIEEQANNYIENIEAQFNFDIASGGSRVDFSSIADKYDAIFVDMSTDVGRTINNIKQAIKDADEAGNKAVAKGLRQTLSKFTAKLNEFFDKAEEAINKQYEYVETSIDNIGATSLQKEGMSRRFNIEKNRTLAEMYAKQESIYGNIYKNQTNDALEELHRNGKLSAETLQRLADTEMKLTQIHWAKQQAEELGEFKTQLEEANDVFKQALEDGLVDYMTDGVNAVLDGTKSIGDAFRDLAVSILKTMQQFFAKRIIENLMNRLYPTFDKEKQIVDTANWQPRDIFNDPSRQQTYQQQMNNPALQSYMRDGYIIKNPVSDITNAYDRGWRPEYEALNPAIQLRTELNELGGAAKSAADALWQIRDYYGGEVKYPDTTQAQMSTDNLAQSMDKASLSTDMNTNSTEANTMAESNSTTTEIQSNIVGQQGNVIGEESNLQTQQHTTDVINDTSSTKQHTEAVGADTKATLYGGSSGDDGGGDYYAGNSIGLPSGFAGAGKTGLTNKNFISKPLNSPMFGGALDFVNSILGSAGAQLAGVGFAIKSFMNGDTKEKLLSMLFVESELLYQVVVSIYATLMQIQSSIQLMNTNTAGFATGGYISGPGTSTSDSIPAMLSDGEFVIKASAVKKYGTNFLDAVNNGTFATIKPRHHYASGGLVTETAREATSTVVTELGRGIGTNINNEAHFNLVMASNQEDAMKAFMRSPEGQRIYLDMARKYASTTVRF